MPVYHHHFQHRQSIGAFILDQPTTPPYIDIDTLSLQDIKQDAALRAVIALRRAGKPVGPNTLAAFEAEPRLVMHCYKRAHADTLRAHLGRHSATKPVRFQRLLSYRHGFWHIADPEQGEAFEKVLDDIVACTRLLEIVTRGFQDVSPKRARRLVATLRRIQRLKDNGLTVVPPHLRQRVRRMRALLRVEIDLNKL